MDITSEIKSMLEEYFEAFHHKDWEKFAGYLSEKFTYFTDNLNERDKKNFVNFLSKDTWQGISYELLDVKVIPSKDNEMALTTYKTSFTGTDKGQELTINALETSVFVKEDGEWKMIHSHTSNAM